MTPTCTHARCDEDATMIAHKDTGQEHGYCDEHGGGNRAGHAWVDKWEDIE